MAEELIYFYSDEYIKSVNSSNIISYNQEFYFCFTSSALVELDAIVFNGKYLRKKIAKYNTGSELPLPTKYINLYCRSSYDNYSKSNQNKFNTKVYNILPISL